MSFAGATGSDSSLYQGTSFPDSNAIDGLRDITITVKALDGTVLDTSPLLNPGNASGFGPNNAGESSDPANQIYNITYDLPAAVNGRIIVVQRTSDGAVGEDDGVILSLGELTADSVTAAPEPASLSFLGIAGLGLLARRRRA